MLPVIVRGDITQIEKLPVFDPQALNSITHCCNCLGAFGRGLALNIRKKYPVVFTQYSELCKKYKANPEKLLGHLQPIAVSELTTVCNLFGQLNYGTEKRQLNYEALYTALEYQAQVAKNTPHMDFYYPYNMGSQLAGGNWMIVESMITALFKDLPNKVYIVQYDKA